MFRTQRQSRPGTSLVQHPPRSVLVNSSPAIVVTRRLRSTRPTISTTVGSVTSADLAGRGLSKYGSDFRIASLDRRLRDPLGSPAPSVFDISDDDAFGGPLHPPHGDLELWEGGGDLAPSLAVDWLVRPTAAGVWHRTCSARHWGAAERGGATSPATLVKTYISTHIKDP